MQILMPSNFDQYVTARSGALLRFAYLLCGDKHLAEDLVQEVLIKAHRRWSAIESENPEPYLKQALVRTHVSWLRRRAATEITTDTFRDAPDLVPFDDQQASRDEVWAMLARLPRAQRAVLVLRYFEDLDDHRIAELVGVSPSTVRVHAHRGLATLRETLVQQGDEAPQGAGMLENVRRGAARAASRRRAAVAGGVAALVAALALLIPLLGPPEGAPPVEPTPTPSGSPTPTPFRDLVLIPTTLTAPEFPYTFGFIPPGLGPGYVDMWEGSYILSYGTSTVNQNMTPLSIHALPDEPIGNPPDTAVRTTVTVNGVQATQLTSPGGVSGPFVSLQWTQDGLWFSASTDGTLSAADLLAFVESMTPGSTTSDRSGPVDALASVGLPVGYAIYEWRDDSLCARPEARTDFPQGLCIGVVTGEVDLPESTFTVNGLPAYWNVLGAQLAVVHPAGQVVTIGHAGDGIEFLDEDLIEIYRRLIFH